MAMESWLCLKSANFINLCKPVFLKIWPQNSESRENSRDVWIILDMSRPFSAVSRGLVCITGCKCGFRF
jgi:hypothetical protein